MTELLFGAGMPDSYHTALGPLQFVPFARETAARAARLHPASVLEIAAGTGIATEALRAALPPSATLTATDISAPMLDYAAARMPNAAVTFQLADAMALPYPDATFDLIACQFGAMLFPDRVRAYREWRRVLAPGGHALCVVWNSLDRNELQLLMSQTLAALFPADPPTFSRRVPYGYSDPAALRADFAAAGFASVAIDVVARDMPPGEAQTYVPGWLRGSPIGREVQARDPGHGLARAEAACVAAMRAAYGAPDATVRLEAVYVTAA